VKIEFLTFDQTCYECSRCGYIFEATDKCLSDEELERFEDNIFDSDKKNRRKNINPITDFRNDFTRKLKRADEHYHKSELENKNLKDEKLDNCNSPVNKSVLKGILHKKNGENIEIRGKR